MKRFSSTIWIVGFASLLVAKMGLSQEEPASEYSDDYAGEYAPEEVDQLGLADGDAPADAPSESQDDSWESYSDLSRASSVAEDITDGVRVEDIIEPPSDYRYAAFGKPDPFVPPLVTQVERIDVVDAPGAIEIPIVSMLQKHELSTLRIVGIYSVHSGERKALVMTPDGSQAAVSVKIGDPIGNRGGKVLAIGVSAVTVREFTLAADGTRQYDDLEMFLGEPEDQAIGARIRFEPGATKTKIIENDNVVKALQEGGGAQVAPADAASDGAQLAPPNQLNVIVSPAGALPADLAPGQSILQNQPTTRSSAASLTPEATTAPPTITVPEKTQATPASSDANGDADGFDY